jgi:hypothetical protein
LMDFRNMAGLKCSGHRTMTAAPRKKRTTPSRPKGTASPISRQIANGGRALRHSAIRAFVGGHR